ncbi:Pre-mRNA-splicing factor Cwf15/Cwc15 [Lipomyces chichibuensis]|uniref:Pre-mRNA-splicing factor Cwf15/Cwc15 n=1 Tax=Lipomyces chichibuensis TaxID=1546026 RepID=UPI003343D754
MTTAHRPTFDPARGKDSQAPTRIYHSRMLPAHTQLKYRKRGQGGVADRADLTTPATSEERLWEREAMKRELLSKEAENDEKKGRKSASSASQLLLEAGNIAEEDEEDEDERKLKRRKMILEEVEKAERGSEGDEGDGENSDSDSGSEENSESESEPEDEEDEEDETAELMRELERIKQERAAEKERQDRERQTAEAAEREQQAIRGNPLLAFNDGFVSSSKSTKRWDEDVVFKNQAKGVDDKPKGGFINDMLRSDFHRKFMNKYVK